MAPIYMLYDLGDVTPHLTPSETDEMRGRNVVRPHPETDQLIDQLTTCIGKFPGPAPLNLLFKCGRETMRGCAEQHLT